MSTETKTKQTWDLDFKSHQTKNKNKNEGKKIETTVKYVDLIYHDIKPGTNHKSNTLSNNCHNNADSQKHTKSIQFKWLTCDGVN